MTTRRRCGTIQRTGFSTIQLRLAPGGSTLMSTFRRSRRRVCSSMSHRTRTRTRGQGVVGHLRRFPLYRVRKEFFARKVESPEQNHGFILQHLNHFLAERSGAPIRRIAYISQTTERICAVTPQAQVVSQFENVSRISICKKKRLEP